MTIAPTAVIVIFPQSQAKVPAACAITLIAFPTLRRRDGTSAAIAALLQMWPVPVEPIQFEAETRVTPSPKPFSASGRTLRLLPPNQKTFEIRQFEQFAQMLANELIERALTVVFANDAEWGFEGCYGEATLTVNVKAMPADWFRATPARLLQN